MGNRVLALDFGASSGRAMLGEYDGESLSLSEIHRFSNDPVMLNVTLYWDTYRLFFEIKQGITKAKHAGGFDSIGINTWGVDFGLLDEDDNLLEAGVHYRDKRTDGMLEELAKLIPLDELYMKTGNQIMVLNTIFQLFSLVKKRPALLERAKTMLLTPDLFNYFLTGVKSTEYTIASTTQLLDPYKKHWNYDLIEKLGIPRRLFTDIVNSGTVVGELSDEICQELGVQKCPIISICSHDTASAVAAVPAQDTDFIFISCGTWSLFGTELSSPLINEKTTKYNITNEGGFGDSIRFLKNIIGLWLIQESRRQWIREGKEYSYAELEHFALECEPFKCFIDPDSPEFVPVGDIPKRVSEFCERTNQYVPKIPGEIMRCIYESLALKYRLAFEQIKDCTDKSYNSIHIVGGGTKDKLLCQMTANACNIKVLAGPIEATVMGNMLIQLIARGEIPNLAQARKIVQKSEKVTEYAPIDATLWEESFQRFLKLQ